MKPQEQVIEKLKKKPISNVKEAIKFLIETDGAENVEEVNYKWIVEFGSKDADKFYFSSDDDLIEWAIEERNKIEECE